jgi:hypothetical protein
MLVQVSKRVGCYKSAARNLRASCLRRQSANKPVLQSLELVIMITKKLLVAYNEAKPTSGQGDFLAVVFTDNKPVFFGLRSRRYYESGRMVFLGKEINEKDMFARLVDSGRKIKSIDETLKKLSVYIQQLGGFKIGNVITVALKNDEIGFELVKIAEMPKTELKSRLP